MFLLKYARYVGMFCFVQKRFDKLKHYFEKEKDPLVRFHFMSMHNL